MKIECNDLNHALREGTSELMEALEAHANACPSCRRALDHWNGLSEAASALRQHWEGPELWPRIHQALAKESEAHRQRILSRLSILLSAGSRWRQVAVAAISILLIISVGWVLTRYFQPPGLRPDSDTEKRLLTEKALHDVEISESAYIQSIARLSRLVEPKIDNATAPLFVIYREKLTLIDGAIAECRAGIERNPFNAHMRMELLSMYQEKQRTLEDLIRTSQNE